MPKMPLSPFFLKNVISFSEQLLTSIFKKLSSRFSLFPATLSLVRGGSKVECSGEGEVSGVKLCGGRWQQTRYADGVCSSRTYGWLPDQVDL